MTKETILFADNDVRFVNTRKEFLEQNNYQVLVAHQPAHAKGILENQKVDLAILDIRMIDDNDQKDVSGLTLAKEVAPEVPKIILTGFPTWEAVKEALGPDINGISLATDFLSKQEGAGALLRAVDLTLNRSYLKTHLFQSFELVSIMELPQRISELGPEEASNRLQESFDDTSKELTQYREQENQRAAQYHFWGLLTSIVGMCLVAISVVLILVKVAEPSILPLIVGAISQAASILFFNREEKAYKRVNTYFKQLNELNNLGNLLTICESLQAEADREEYKKKIIDKVTNRWFTDQP